MRRFRRIDPRPSRSKTVPRLSQLRKLTLSFHENLRTSRFLPTRGDYSPRFIHFSSGSVLNVPCCAIARNNPRYRVWESKEFQNRIFDSRRPHRLARIVTDTLLINGLYIIKLSNSEMGIAQLATPRFALIVGSSADLRVTDSQPAYAVQHPPT